MAAVHSRLLNIPFHLNSDSERQKKKKTRVLQLDHPPASPENICKLSVLLKDSELLPDRFVIPEKHRPRIPHDAYVSSEVELPMIDLSLPLSSIVREVGKACEEWGFFQIVNHSVPNTLLSEMHLHAKDFFKLPYEQKERAAIFSRPLGYNGRYSDISSSAPWIEALGMQQTPFSTVDKTIESVWPRGNLKFRRAVWRYHAEMEKLGQTIVELLALSLGLDKDVFSRHFRDGSSTMFRWNHYPPCPLPSKALGLLAHSDPSAITILHQDHVGGLQIRREGKWIAVKPCPDAFIVNLGDVFQAWTNGRYKSVEHRAVVNRTQARLSMVFFYGPKEDYVITPPDELVDEDHPRLYRPFTWGEYNASRFKIPAHGKQPLDIFAGL